MGDEPGANLAIVSSPLQALNADEWRAAVGGPCDLVVIGDRHAGGLDEVMERCGPWRTILRHGRRPRPPRMIPRLAKDALDAWHRAGLERLAKRLAARAYARVAFGDYRNVSQRLLVDRVSRSDATLLDDGSVTPQAAAFRADPASVLEPGQFDLAWFRTALARRLFGDPLIPGPDRVTFFTIYGRLIESGLAAADALAENRYETLRGRARPAPRGGAAWLIGANHSEAGICAAEDYRALALAAVCRLRAEGRDPIVYRRHRGQSPQAAADLSQAAGMTLAPSTAPVELDYLDAVERPATVAVFASTAADTLATLDPDLDIARIALPATYLRKRVHHIQAVVAGHDAFNPRLRVIDLDMTPPRESGNR